MLKPGHPPEDRKNNLVVILGPTGVGKSHLALRLARLFDGEIINADSRQVYRLMDIGTAKPAPEILTEVPHHLFNIVDPDEEFNVGMFVAASRRIINEIHGRSKIPLLVGGSGQYVWGLLEGWQIPSVPPDATLRSDLQDLAVREGMDQLYGRLLEIDAAAAQKIDKRNIRRVIRALEVAHEAGAAGSQRPRKKTPDYRVLIIGLSAERKALYQKTDARVEEMFQKGLVQEVSGLNTLGYKEGLSSMNSIGYKQIMAMLRGESTEGETISRIKTDTHRFIRHQYAWFKLRDKRISWFDAGSDYFPEVTYLLDGFLN